MNLATCVAGIALVASMGCGLMGKKDQTAAIPHVYLIANGATGWVKIVYNHPEEKELPVSDGAALVQVDRDLKFFTSSRMGPTFEGAKFFYLTASGKRVALSVSDGPNRMVWGQDKASGEGGEYETFFIGTDEQMSAKVHTKILREGMTGDPPVPGVPTPVTDREKVLTELPK